MNFMQAVILAAGRGARMGKLTENTPKPMLEIKGKPILAYSIESLPSEIDEVVLIVGYLKEKVMEYFGESFAGKKIKYAVQEKLDGTGGAVHLAKDILKGKFLVMVGDDLYLKKDIEKMIRHDLAVLTFKVSDPERFGIIKTDENGKVVDIIEKPKMQGPALANVGMYILNTDFFNYSLFDLGNGEFGLPQTLMKMSDKYKINFEKATDWFPIGNQDDFEKAQTIIYKFSGDPNDSNRHSNVLNEIH